MSSDAELRERLTVANERLVDERLADALLMFESEDARLTHLADVIDELARAIRAIDGLGANLDPSTRLPTGDPLPHELDRDGPRTPVLAWQGFDRALEALLARRDAPPIDLAALADGYEQLAQAARKVVAALRSSIDSYASELIRCTLRNKRRSEVPEMVIGPGKFVCSECVELLRRDPRGASRRRLTGPGASADSALTGGAVEFARDDRRRAAASVARAAK